MRYTKSDFPIGATWELIKRGRIYRIWLSERNSRYDFENWKASYSCDDGSGLDFDWFTSYRLARDWCPVNGRFKRIK